MGQLIYIVNHTIKEWFCPDASKWSEVLINDFIMRGILYLFRHRWNNCKISFYGGYNTDLDEIREKYKEIKIDFDDYRDW